MQEGSDGQKGCRPVNEIEQAADGASPGGRKNSKRESRCLQAGARAAATRARAQAAAVAGSLRSWRVTDRMVTNSSAAAQAGQQRTRESVRPGVQPRPTGPSPTLKPKALVSSSAQSGEQQQGPRAGRTRGVDADGGVQLRLGGSHLHRHPHALHDLRRVGAHLRPRGSVGEQRASWVSRGAGGEGQEVRGSSRGRPARCPQGPGPAWGAARQAGLAHAAGWRRRRRQAASARRSGASPHHVAAHHHAGISSHKQLHQGAPRVAAAVRFAAQAVGWVRVGQQVGQGAAGHRLAGHGPAGRPSALLLVLLPPALPLGPQRAQRAGSAAQRSATAVGSGRAGAAPTHLMVLRMGRKAEV